MTDYAWFAPLTLKACHFHPNDDTIQSITERLFYVRWVDHAVSAGFDDTLAVTAIHFPADTSVSGILSQPTQHDDRRTAGIDMHRRIECLLNGCPMSGPLYPQILSYHQDIMEQGFIPWRTEMAIRSSADLRIVGVVDALFMRTGTDDDDDGTLRLYMKDWKYSRDISTHIHHYQFQLNMYKYILETQYVNSLPFYVGTRTYTNIQVQSMELVLFHEDNETYAVTTVSDIQPHVRSFVVDRKKQLAATKNKCNL
jgi:hypothetical protein